MSALLLHLQAVRARTSHDAFELAQCIQLMGRSILEHWDELVSWQRKRRVHILIRNFDRLVSLPRAAVNAPEARQACVGANDVIVRIKALLEPLAAREVDRRRVATTADASACPPAERNCWPHAA